MSDYKYHSALKIGLDVLEDVEPLDRFEKAGNIGLQHDFVRYGLPNEMLKCHVIYGECPWPQGFKVFDERAGQSSRPYNLFKYATKDMIERESRPIFLILGKTLLSALPNPIDTAEIKLNGGPVTLAWWNCSYTGPVTNNIDVTSYLGSRFKSIGDFCCGYGEPLFAFLRGGGEYFVGSDHNGKCIRVLQERVSNEVLSG